MSEAPLGLGLEQTVSALQAREFSVQALTAATLAALGDIGVRLNAVARCEQHDALAQAATLDRLGERDAAVLPLFGAVLAHKDLYMRAGWRIEAGSRLLGQAATRTANTLQRLQDAGSVDCARLSTVEFALGVTGHNRVTGHVHNPWNPDYVPGGSSSGSAVAVAAGLVPAALGSDTGGSIRFPAAACGIVGLKPTNGLVGRSGIVPLSFSLDTAGPLTRNVRDCALILQSLAGYDAGDSASLARAPVDYLGGIEAGLGGVRVGVPENYFFDTVDDTVGSRLEEVRTMLARLATTRAVTVGRVEQANQLAMLIISVEGAAEHAGRLRTQAAGYGSQTLARLITGLFVPADAYLRALDFRQRFVRHTLATVFNEVDLLFVPMWPRRLPTLAATDVGGDAGYAELVGAMGHCSRPFNMLGFPAITLPCGFDAAGLPLSLQLVARPFEEALLLRAARALERELGAAARVPPVSVWA